MTCKNLMTAQERARSGNSAAPVSLNEYLSQRVSTHEHDEELTSQPQQQMGTCEVIDIVKNMLNTVEKENATMRSMMLQMLDEVRQIKHDTSKISDAQHKLLAVLVEHQRMLQK